MVRSVVVAVLLSSAALAVQIPSGTELQIRLKTAVAASSAKAGQKLEAVIIEPVVVNGQLAILPGALVEGTVQEAKPSTGADVRASLLPAFTKLKTADGKKTAAIDAKVTSVDNARETVDDKGTIAGILASETLAGRADQGIEKVSQKSQSFGDLLSAVKGVFFKDDVDTDINYPAGTEMTLALNKAMSWTESGSLPKLSDIAPASAVADLVTREPFRTVTDKTNKPSDVTNVMLLGSRQQVEEAFTAAGWSTAEALNAQSKIETARAIGELRGYKEALVSILLLDGQKPDLVFQKQLNTFAKRHHVRIWRRPGQFQGRDIWVCSSTHDTGIDFSPENRTFIHKIDSNIDRERAKVVSDLLFTGKVVGLALVERPDVPTNAKNGTGDDLLTDGRMAVLEF